MFESLIELKYVDIVSIVSNIPRSHFELDQLEMLARNFLEAGGCTKPVILKRIDNDLFEVVQGDLEFYASQRAKEINDDFELIQAIIMDDSNQTAIEKQLNLLLADNDLVEKVEGVGNYRNSSQDISRVLSNLENNFSERLRLFESKIKDNFEKINDFIELKTANLSALEKFNELPLRELELDLRRCNILSKKGNRSASNIAQLIVTARNEEKFHSLQDIIDRLYIFSSGKRARAITEKTMIKLLDSWSRP